MERRRVLMGAESHVHAATRQEQGSALVLEPGVEGEDASNAARPRPGHGGLQRDRTRRDDAVRGEVEGPQLEGDGSRGSPHFGDGVDPHRQRIHHGRAGDADLRVDVVERLIVGNEIRDREHTLADHEIRERHRHVIERQRRAEALRPERHRAPASLQGSVGVEHVEHVVHRHDDEQVADRAVGLWHARHVERLRVHLALHVKRADLVKLAGAYARDRERSLPERRTGAAIVVAVRDDGGSGEPSAISGRGGRAWDKG